MRFLLLTAYFVGIYSAALAVDKQSALKIETYTIVADSICAPSDCEDFFDRALVARKRSGTEDRNRFIDSLLAYFEFEYDYVRNRVTWNATAQDGVVWSIYEHRDMNTDFMSDYSLFRGDSLIYDFRTINSAFGKPAFRLAGFYEDTWFLSYWYAHIENRPGEYQIDSSTVHLVIDGVDLNAKYDYQNCYFTFNSYVNGKLFYIFDRHGQAGWCYDGVETPAQFDCILHTYEPGLRKTDWAWRVHVYRDWFDFIALRDGMWYYVVGSVEDQNH